VTVAWTEKAFPSGYVLRGAVYRGNVRTSDSYLSVTVILCSHAISPLFVQISLGWTLLE